jgi:hypothetical protein
MKTNNDPNYGAAHEIKLPSSKAEPIGSALLIPPTVLLFSRAKKQLSARPQRDSLPKIFGHNAATSKATLALPRPRMSIMKVTASPHKAGLASGCLMRDMVGILGKQL